LQGEWSLFALERPDFSKLSVDREIGIKSVNAERLQLSIRLIGNDDANQEALTPADLIAGSDNLEIEAWRCRVWRFTAASERGRHEEHSREQNQENLGHQLSPSN
jgi:hypothetical protein